MTTAVAKRGRNEAARPEQGKLGTLRELLESQRDRFQEVAPKYLSVERVTRLLLAACSRSPKVMECSTPSVLLFAMRCCETGLEPIGAGGAWPVPFRNTKHDPPIMELQFIPDWRGLIQTAKRTQQIRHAYADVIYEEDKYDYRKGDDPHLEHRPAIMTRGKPLAAYAIVLLPDGEKHIELMSYQEIEAIRGRSKAGDYGPWKTDWAEMAKKTVVRRALKPFASSPQLAAAIEYDNEASGLRTDIATPLNVAHTTSRAAALAEKIAPEAPEPEPLSPAPATQEGEPKAFDPPDENTAGDDDAPQEGVGDSHIARVREGENLLTKAQRKAIRLRNRLGLETPIETMNEEELGAYEAAINACLNANTSEADR